jgi:hypothetical protein
VREAATGAQARSHGPAGGGLRCGMPRTVPRTLVHLLDPAARYLESAPTSPVPVPAGSGAAGGARDRLVRRQARARELARGHRRILDEAALALLGASHGDLATTEGRLELHLVRFAWGDHVLEVRGPRLGPAGGAVTRRTRLVRWPARATLEALVGQLAWQVAGLGPRAEPAAQPARAIPGAAPARPAPARPAPSRPATPGPGSTAR